MSEAPSARCFAYVAVDGPLLLKKLAPIEAAGALHPALGARSRAEIGVDPEHFHLIAPYETIRGNGRRCNGSISIRATASAIASRLQGRTDRGPSRV